MKTTLGLFPLGAVLVPGGILRLHIFEERYKRMIGDCIAGHAEFGVVLDREGREAGDGLDPEGVGTAAEIKQVRYLSEGRLFIVTRGTRRFRVDRVVDRLPFWSADVTFLDERIGPAATAARLQATALEHFKDYLQELLAVSGSDLDGIELPDDATRSSYLIADALQVDTALKQRLLEAGTAAERLRDELRLLVTETRRLRAVRSTKAADPMASMAAPFAVRFSRN